MARRATLLRPGEGDIVHRHANIVQQLHCHVAGIEGRHHKALHSAAKDRLVDGAVDGADLGACG